MKKINIILPVYNEEQVIGLFTKALLEVTNALSSRYQFEIIYVLDKSTDRSQQVIEGICKNHSNTKLVVLSRRFGHQMSLVAGMDQCDGDAVIMMDSDLQHPPSVIPALLEQFEKGFDVVHTLREDTKKIGFLKKRSSKLFYKLLRSMSEIYISQDAADFRLISKKVLSVFQGNIREQNQFLRGLFHWVGFEQTYVSFQASERAHGVSKYNLRRLIRFAMMGITSFSKVPLKWSITIGFFVSLVSIFYAVYLIATFAYSKELPPGWTTITVILLFFMGIQFIFMGILGEYVGAIFDETKKRPLYIVERVVGGKQVVMTKRDEI